MAVSGQDGRRRRSRRDTCLAVDGVQEFIEIFGPPQSAEFAGVVVRRQAMVAAPLDVNRSQILAEFLAISEQKFCNLKRKKLQLLKNNKN